MRNLDLRSIGYAFIANEANVYFPDRDENFIIIERLVCGDCGARWYTSMLECFFCGEINYYLYQCVSCKKFYPITDSKPRCDCGSKDSQLIKACVNKKCPTNSNEEISKIAKKYKGVFDLKSSLKLSLMYCLKCGSPRNRYKIAKLFVFNAQRHSSFQDYLKQVQTEIFANDVILLKTKAQGKLIYDFLKYHSDANLPLKPYRFHSVSELVEAIFREI